MKRRLVGGLILLNLCVISLNLSAGEQDITDNDVLDQLVGLREYIDEKRDFTKESKGLKPVLVQYRSNASKIDGIVQCNLSFNTDALHLSIGGYSVQADGTPITLTINVVYEWTEYIGYTIKSAKLNATNDLKTSSFNGIAPTSSDNGKVLGIDANGNYELKTIAGVTPLYIHPILVINSYVSPRAINISLFVFDNNSQDYDSWVELKVKMKSVQDSLPSGQLSARFPTTGYFSYDNKHVVACHIFTGYANDEFFVKVEGSDSTTGEIVQYDITDLELICFDGVNQLL